MKIEVKNVKFVEALSEETYCFTASIRVDGKKVGEASNRGQEDKQTLYITTATHTNQRPIKL